MKNTVSFCVVVFLLLMNTTVFGQNNAFVQQASISNQMDAFSPEIVELVDRFMNEADLFKISENMLREGADFQEGFISVEIAFEIVYTYEAVPTTWNRPRNNITFYNTPSIAKENGFFAFIEPLNHSNKLGFFASHIAYSDQNITNRNNQSIVLVDNTIDWLELGEEDWRLDKSIQLQVPTSSLGNWHFIVGHDKNSSQFIPVDL